MIRDDIRQLKTGAKELRNFGLVVGGVFTAIGITLWFRQSPRFLWLLIPGLVLMFAGTFVPRILKFIYVAWMSAAFVLGFIVSHLILALFFFLVITPTGIAARILGKDFLRMRLDRDAESYWIPRESRKRSKAEHEQQF